VKPPPFDYVLPATVDEVVVTLAASENARVLAGGQSLVPLLNLRLARPDVVVDVNALSELDFVEASNGSVRIGALTRHRTLELDPTAAEVVPLLAEAASLVGHPHIRNRATVGGSVAHADPAAEFGAVLVALEGSVVVQGPSGRRSIDARDLYEGFFTTSIRPDELLVEVVVPARGSSTGYAFREFAPRHGDFATAGIAASVELGDGRCIAARLAGCGLGTTPVDLSPCAESLVGASEASREVLEDVASRVAAAVDPNGDVHGSAEYRRELAQLLAAEAARLAWERASGGPR